MAERPRFDLEDALAVMPRPEFRERLRAELRRKAESMSLSHIPAGHHTATSYLIVDNAAAALEFYQKAFGAREVVRVPGPDGRIVHADLEIGDSHIMLADEHPEIGAFSPPHYGGSPVTVMLYVERVDEVVAEAVRAGAKVMRPVKDQPYGDRSGILDDPFGHRWIVATHHSRKWLPLGYSSITPYLQVRGAGRLIDFLKQAYGAEEKIRVPRPDGTIMHAQLRIGDSAVELADGNEQYQAGEVDLHLYVPDTDAVYLRAIHAGGQSLAEPGDKPYGDREAGVKDPSGNRWWIATHQSGSHVPEGLRAVTLFFNPRGAPRFIEYLQKAFDAEVASRHEGPDGTVHHAVVRIGDSAIEMGEAHGEYQPTPCAIHLYVPDADAVYRQALAAGGVSLSEPADRPYGERSGGVADPFGNIWYIATRLAGPSIATPADEH